jgi:hypothetical protein
LPNSTVGYLTDRTERGRGGSPIDGVGNATLSIANLPSAAIELTFRSRLGRPELSGRRIDFRVVESTTACQN